MIIFIIPVLFFVVGFYSGINEYFGGFGLGLLKGVFALAISIGLVMAIIGITSVIAPTHYNLTWQRELVSLKGKQSVHGDFFLGTGKIDSNMKYYYFYQKESGYKLESVNASKATLSYSNNPNIKKKQQYFDNNLISLIVSPVAWGYTYHIEIPEDSIKRDFVPIS